MIYCILFFLDDGGAVLLVDATVRTGETNAPSSERATLVFDRVFFLMVNHNNNRVCISIEQGISRGRRPILSTTKCACRLVFHLWFCFSTVVLCDSTRCFICTLLPWQPGMEATTSLQNLRFCFSRISGVKPCIPCTTGRTTR